MVRNSVTPEVRVERLTVTRYRGGIGVINLQRLNDKQILVSNIEQYFQRETKASKLLRAQRTGRWNWRTAEEGTV